MKEESLFTKLFYTTLFEESIPDTARTSAYKRKKDAIAKLRRRHSFELKELVRKDYVESLRLKERHNNRRAALIEKHREEMSRLEARRWK